MQNFKHLLRYYLILGLRSCLLTLVLMGGLVVLVKGQAFTIQGPSSICPVQQYTYTLKQNTVVAPCQIIWYVRRNGSVIFGGQVGSGINYTSDNILGPVTVEADVTYGQGCASNTTYTKTVNITYKTPAPISGPNPICFGQTKSYTTAGLTNTSADCFFNHQYRWTVPAGWKVEGQSGSYTGVKKTVSIQAPGSGTAQAVQIKVEGYYNNIGVYTPARVFQIQLGKPAVPSSISGPSNVLENDVVGYSISAVPGASSYSWQVPSGWLLVNGTGVTAIARPRINSGNVKVRAENACGNSIYKNKWVQISGGFLLSVANQQIQMYPNPSKNYIDLIINKQDEVMSKPFSADYNPAPDRQGDPKILKLYNLRGELVYSESMTGNYQKINTAHLQNGQYILHVVTHDKTIREKVFIEK